MLIANVCGEWIHIQITDLKMVKGDAKMKVCKIQWKL